MGVVSGTFQLPNGSAVANGLYQFKLSGDALLFSTAAAAPRLFTGYLDSNGNFTTTCAFNDVLLTSAGTPTTYQLTVKDTGGGQVWNETYYLSGTSTSINVSLPGAGPGGNMFFPFSIIVTTTITFSATPTFTAASPAQLFKMTLTGNVTSSTLVTTAPSFIIFELTQDATGGRTFTWPTNVLGGATIGVQPSKTTSQFFFWDGSNAIALGGGVVTP